MDPANDDSASGMRTDQFDSHWWYRRRQELLDLGERYLNAWVYDAGTISAAFRRLRKLESVDRILFAMKSNSNPDVLRLLDSLGADFECVSPMEIEHLLREVPGLDRTRVLFTPNFAPREDYEWAVANDICVTLDNLYPLREWQEVFAGRDVFVRIDPGIGRGHHDHVVTAGDRSKFGISRFELNELARLADGLGTRVVGIHAHSGSGIPQADTWGQLATVLAEAAEQFPSARVLDLGGGLGVPARPGEAAFDLAGMDAALLDVRRAFPDYDIWIEPGRYLVAEAGVLLAHVTQLKGKGNSQYVGISTGMNALIRPTLYNAWHEIINLTRIDEPTDRTVTIVGPICETGDTLGRDRAFPDSRGGDVVLVLTAGAYGRAMSSEYNLRPIPVEIMLD